MTELERDFTFSLPKYPSLIFVFLAVDLEIRPTRDVNVSLIGKLV